MIQGFQVDDGEIIWLAERLLASQDVLCPVGLFEETEQRAWQLMVGRHHHVSSFHRGRWCAAVTSLCWPVDSQRACCFLHKLNVYIQLHRGVMVQHTMQFYIVVLVSPLVPARFVFVISLPLYLLVLSSFFLSFLFSSSDFLYLFLIPFSLLGWLN
jgi:hypothetical protein